MITQDNIQAAAVQSSFSIPAAIDMYNPMSHIAPGEHFARRSHERSLSGVDDRTPGR